MKIAFFSDTYLPSVNGIAMYLKSISESLANQGHQVYIFTPKVSTGEPIPPAHKNVKINFLPSIPSYIYHDLRIAPPLSVSLLAEIYELEPDIIHLHTQFGAGAQAIFIAKMLKKPLVATFHGYFWEPEYLKVIKLDKLDKGKTLSNFGWRLNNFILGQADLIISPSERSRTDLIDHKFKKRVEVVSNGVDPLAYKTDKSNSYNLPSKYFVYAGRVSVEKSLHILIKAFHLFSQKNQDVDLVIAGDGPARKKVEALIQQLNLEKRVHILGMIEHTKLIDSNILPSAIAFVTSSKSESQPVSILEALAVKLPIIGVNEKGVPELVKDNGLLCPPDNFKEFSKAMEKITNDPSLRKKMSDASYALAKTHSLEESTKRLITLYKEAILEKESSESEEL